MQAFWRTFKRNVWVHPIHEDDPMDIVGLIGPDRVLFGSDDPHLGGLAQLRSTIERLQGLDPEDITRTMGGNLAQVVKVSS